MLDINVQLYITTRNPDRAKYNDSQSSVLLPIIR